MAGLCVLLIAANASISARRRRDSESGRKKEQAAKKSQRSAKPTYLDTLNKDDELYLREEDVGEIARADNALPEKTPAGDTKQSKGFRIQCFAASSIQAVRREKKKAEEKLKEEKLKYDTYIVFHEPYFKLHVGNFAKRKAAEQALAKIKKAGYAEAWIVPGSISVDR
jgi:hypothetical protein